jgi:hypothetical protein
MDCQEQVCQARLERAAKQLGALPQQVASLKLRENVDGDHVAQYRALIGTLTQDAGLKSTPANDNLVGNGYVVEKSRTKIILVEHESGLEVLYIAGSIASLVGLIPLVLRCWSAIRRHGGRPGRHDLEMADIRRLGHDGRIIEDRSHEPGAPWGFSISVLNDVLLGAAEKMDAEFSELRKALHALTARVVALEGRSASKTRSRKQHSRRKPRK